MCLSDQKFIAKLSFNFNFNLIGSWDSFILILTKKLKPKLSNKNNTEFENGGIFKIYKSYVDPISVGGACAAPN